jgi:hypothetical protein
MPFAPKENQSLKGSKDSYRCNQMAQQQQQLVWFQLVDSTGSPFKGTSISSVLRTSLVAPVVDLFRDAVKANFDQPGYLKDFPSAALIVYENKDKEKQFPLKPSQILDQLEISDKDVLIVVVPTSAPQATTSQLPFWGDTQICSWILLKGQWNAFLCIMFFWKVQFFRSSYRLYQLFFWILFIKQCVSVSHM